MAKDGSQKVQAATDINTARLILIVVGAHLKAELADRPTADLLRQRLSAWLTKHEPDSNCTVALCTDLWYLNVDDLRAQPTISVGSPGVNALTAYLGDKIPSAFTIDNVLCVQLDLDMTDLIACCWGADAHTTLAAVDAFCDRYLDAFMRKATLRLSVG